MTCPVLTIDGECFSTLEEFYAEVSRALIPGADWGHNLDAFNDILRGGFGTPDGGFTLRWLHHSSSRQRLAYPETARQLRLHLARCHPSNRDALARALLDAEAGVGPTVFDWVIEIIRCHGADGTEAEDGVVLLLD